MDTSVHTAAPCSRDDWSLRLRPLGTTLWTSNYPGVYSTAFPAVPTVVRQPGYFDRRVQVSRTWIPLQLAARLLARALPVPRTGHTCTPYACPLSHASLLS